MNQGFVYLVGAVVTLFLASSIFSPPGTKPPAATIAPATPTVSPSSASSKPKDSPPTDSEDAIREELKSKLPPELAASFLSQRFQDVCVFVRGSKEERSTYIPLMKSLKSFLPRAGSFVFSMEYEAYNYFTSEVPKSGVPILTRDENPEFYQRIFHKLTADLYCLRPYILFLDPSHFLFKTIAESDIFDEDGKIWVFTRNYSTSEESKLNKRNEKDIDRLYSLEQQRKMVKKYLDLDLGTSLDDIQNRNEKKQKEVFLSHIKPKIYPIGLLKDLRDRIEAKTGNTIEHLIHQLSRGQCFSTGHNGDKELEQRRKDLDECFFDVEILLSALLQANTTSSFATKSENVNQNEIDKKVHLVNIDRPYDSLTQAEKLRIRRHFLSDNQELTSFFLESRFNIIDSTTGQRVSLLSPPLGQTPSALPQGPSSLPQPTPTLIPSSSSKSSSRELEFSSPVYNDFVNSVLGGKCLPDGVELSVDWDYVFCKQFGVPFTNHLFYPNSPSIEHRAPTPPKKRRKPPTA